MLARADELLHDDVNSARAHDRLLDRSDRRRGLSLDPKNGTIDGTDLEVER
jgi:hypothetical protein